MRFVKVLLMTCASFVLMMLEGNFKDLIGKLDLTILKSKTAN